MVDLTELLDSKMIDETDKFNLITIRYLLYKFDLNYDNVSEAILDIVVYDMYTTGRLIDSVNDLPDEERRYFEYEFTYAEFEKHFLFEGFHDLNGDGVENYYFLKIYFDRDLEGQMVKEGVAEQRDTPFYCKIYDSDGDWYTENF